MANSAAAGFQRIPSPDGLPASMKAYVRRVNDVLEELTTKVNGYLVYDGLSSSAKKKIATDAQNTTDTAIDNLVVDESKIADQAVTHTKINLDDLFAHAAFLQKLQVAAAPSVDTLPSDPVAGQCLIYAGVTPNELLRWTGNGINPTQRRYSASKSGASVSITDLSDDYALDVTAKTVAAQAGSGTQSPDNIRALSGKPTVTVSVGDADTTLTPDATLYGLTGYEDEIGNSGDVTHKTALFTCRGTSGFTHMPSMQLTNTAIFQCTLPVASPAGVYAQSVCSHLPRNTAGGGTDSELQYVFNSIKIRVAKSRLTGWSDALTDAQKVALFNVWLEAQNTAGTPVQVVYQLATATTATGTATEINGTNGTNIVTSNGASVVVAYTGSGWAAAGSMQRMAVESVKITPEEGLRVDTVLVSDDASQSVNTYFNARGTKYGLFRLSDGKLLNGAKVLSNGSVAGVVGALIDPDGDGKSYFLVVTSDNNTELVQVQNSYAGVTTEENPTPVDFIYAIDIGSSNTGTYFSGSWHDEFMSWCHGKGTFQVRAVDGALYLVGDTGGVCLGYIGSDYTPLTTNTYLMGDASHGIKKYYGASTSIQSTSDERAKHDMRPLDADQMQRFLLALNPIWYRLNDVPVDLMAGFGAFGFRDAMRSAGIPDDFAGFNGKDPDHLCLDYGQVIAPLVSVVQTQQSKIDDLERRLAALEQRIG